MAQTPQPSPQPSPLEQGKDIGLALAQAAAPGLAPAQPRVVQPAPTADEISDSPWKYAGYRDFSRWIASDQAWFITRRFSTVNARIILSLQDNVVRLEEELDQLDRVYSQCGTVMQDEDNTHNGSFRLEVFDDRKKVICELTKALKEYNSFVNEYSQLASRPPVREGDVKAVRIWLHNHNNAIHDPEAAYIKEEHDDDLIPVNPKTRSWLRKVLEKTSLLTTPPLKWYLTRRPSDPVISKKDQDSIWHNEKRVERFSASVIGLVGLAMLIGPIWILDKVANDNIRLGVISAFIVIFYILVGIATTAKIFESLAAVAAYSAVLMVFMQIQRP